MLTMNQTFSHEKVFHFFSSHSFFPIKHQQMIIWNNNSSHSKRSIAGSRYYSGGFGPSLEICDQSLIILCLTCIVNCTPSFPAWNWSKQLNFVSMHKMGLKGMFEMHLYIIYYRLDLSEYQCSCHFNKVIIGGLTQCNAKYILSCKRYPCLPLTEAFLVIFCILEYNLIWLSNTMVLTGFLKVILIRNCLYFGTEKVFLLLGTAD